MLVDTNLWLLGARGRVHLEEISGIVPGAALYAPREALRELAVLGALGRPEATGALRLAARASILPSPGRGDAAILAAARRAGVILATADRELERRALAAGVPVLGLRERGRFALRRATRGKIMKRPRLVRPTPRSTDARRRQAAPADRR